MPLFHSATKDKFLNDKTLTQKSCISSEVGHSFVATLLIGACCLAEKG